METFIYVCFSTVFLVVCLIPYWSQIKAWLVRNAAVIRHELTTIPEPDWFTRMNLGEVASEH